MHRSVPETKSRKLWEKSKEGDLEPGHQANDVLKRSGTFCSSNSFLSFCTG